MVRAPIPLNGSEGRKHESKAVKKQHLDCLSIEELKAPCSVDWSVLELCTQ